MKTNVYPTAAATAHALIERLLALMAHEPEKIFHVAFSGGSTPSLMFDIWANVYREATPWARMRIYWVEAKEYSKLVCRTVPLVEGVPAFDVVLLGAGEDGHTSSIFPGQEHLLSSPHPYAVSVHPSTGQQRIAMTGCLLFAARRLIFLITGRSKSCVVRDMLASADAGPAAYVAHRHAGEVELFLDVEASGE